jgi:uncharacterized RDD family membrane protein YckC
VSAYPSAPAPAHYLYKAPTDVVGKRIGAYLLDGLFTSIILGVLVFSLLHHTTGNPDRTCADRQGTSMCFQFGSDVYDVPTDDSWKIAVGNGLWFLGASVLLQGLAGGTLGKLIVGIRVVDADGRLCGPWRAFLRSVPFAVGTLGYIWGTRGAMTLAGLVATAIVVTELVALLSRKNHQRFGDVAAGTFVIDKHYVGQPVPDPQSAIYAGQAWPGQGWGPGSAPGWGGPAAPESLPQWDPARDTYIWWDAERGEWLEHDRASGEWQPISR